jgi:TPR repeat protein
VAAGTFEDAVDAHDRGDYAKALRLIRPLANNGDARAQFNLGLMYVTGQGVQQDNAAAALWFREAAEQGYALAQSNLGTQGEQRAVKTLEMAERRMTQAQISEAQKLARGCKPATQPTLH